MSTVSMAGAARVPISSSSSTMLSASAHCRSSIQITRPRPVEMRANTAASDATARSRTSSGSRDAGAWSRDACAMAGTWSSTGNTRERAQASGGRTSAACSNGSDTRWRLSSSTTPSSAL
ncbi:MAG: hypothetical protein R2712_28445 [Vicinamibacterales bacterium]